MKKYFFILCVFTICQWHFYSSFAQASLHPNVLIILTDDMKWNSIGILNDQNILLTPNIDRIGLEGANINYHCINSLCVPGRAALLTGQYGHRYGLMNNNQRVPDSVLMLPQIFHDSGYYTAMIGKWMLSPTIPYPDYFDYWLTSKSKVFYYGDTCYYYNTPLATGEHMTDFLTDSALALISRIDTPFFMMLNHNAPHLDWVPQAEFDGVFDTCVFPVPQNFNSYHNNYPDFLYDDPNNIVFNYNDEQSKLRDYYEMMAGVEESVGKVLDELESRNLLDNTIVIFTTDNSSLIGEHRLRRKQHPYEEGMRMPLLIRYPPLFASGTVMNEDFILNIDVAPTLLKLAGINYSSFMDGIPLQDIFNGDTMRTIFLYEQKHAVSDSLPEVRTVRDHYFQYSKYYCSDTTEELFDEINDSFQKINLATNVAFQNILHQYRIKLDSMRLALNDTAPISIANCHLYIDTALSVMPTIDSNYLIFPNPSAQVFNIQSSSLKKINYEVLNVLGQKIHSGVFDFSKSEFQKIELSGKASGIYLLRLKEENFSMRLVKSD